MLLRTGKPLYGELNKENVESILGEGVIKHPRRKELEPLREHLRSFYEDHVAFLKKVDGAKANFSKIKHIPGKVAEAALAISIMTFCIYLYKRIPNAESAKSKAGFARELRLQLGSKKSDIPAVLWQRLSKATANQE